MAVCCNIEFCTNYNGPHHGIQTLSEILSSTRFDQPKGRYPDDINQGRVNILTRICSHDACIHRPVVSTTRDIQICQFATAHELPYTQRANQLAIDKFLSDLTDHTKPLLRTVTINGLHDHLQIFVIHKPLFAGCFRTYVCFQSGPSGVP